MDRTTHYYRLIAIYNSELPDPRSYWTGNICATPKLRAWGLELGWAKGVINPLPLGYAYVCDKSTIIRRKYLQIKK